MTNVESKLVWDVTGNQMDLVGALNESSDFSKISLPADVKMLKINCSRLTTINSSGLRMFLTFLRGCPVPYEYWGCSSDFVDQLNMIPSLLNKSDGTKGVRSVLLQCACGSCGTEQKIELNERDLIAIAKGGHAGLKTCQSCKADLQEDLTNACYFLNS